MNEFPDQGIELKIYKLSFQKKAFCKISQSPQSGDLQDSLDAIAALVMGTLNKLGTIEPQRNSTQ